MNPANSAPFSSDLWMPTLDSYASDTHLTVQLFATDLRVVFGPVHPTPLFSLFEERGYDPGLFAECARRCLLQTDNRPAVIVNKVYGLAAVGTSLVLEGKIVGAAVAGYAFVDFSQLSEVQRLAKDAGIQFERLWQIAREQKPVPQQRLMLNGELLQVLGDALLRENYRTRQYEETALKLEKAVWEKDRALQELQRTASCLRESEQHYRVLFDLGPVAVYSCDASGVIQEYNRRAGELWGRRPAPGDTDEKFCGSFKLFRADGSFMPHEQCPMAEVVSGKISEVHDAEVLIERPDGSQVTVIVDIRPLKNPRGEVMGAINCFYDISQRKQSEEALQRAHDELESLVQRRTASLRRLSSRLQNVQDEERRKMARELHDSAGQYLAAVKMNLAQLDHAGLSKEKAAAVADSEQLIDKCLGEIRTVSYLLHPPLMDEGGLASAARFYIDGFAKRSKIEIDLAVPPRLERMPQPVEMVLFRALQESLTNVHRHSGSSKVSIRIEVENGEVSLTVRDFGRGIAPNLASFEQGFDVGVGLAGMRERVSELGGFLQILPETPGTLLTVTVPISHKQTGISSEDRSDEHGSAA